MAIRLTTLFLSLLILGGCNPLDRTPVGGRVILSGLSKGNILPTKGHPSSPYPNLPIGGAQYLVSRVKILKNEAVSEGLVPFFFDLGDSFSGSPEAYFTQGEAVVDVFNHIALDGMLIGNIDFAFGVSVLQSLANRAKFPLLASNLKFAGTPFFKKSIVIEKGGFKIAFLGRVPPDTPQMTVPQNVSGVDFSASDSLIIEMAKDLKKQGVDLVILLSQINFRRQEEIHLFESQSAIDLVVALDYDKELTVPFPYASTTLKLVNGFNRGQELDYFDFKKVGEKFEIKWGGRIPLLHEKVQPDLDMADLLAGYVRKIDGVKNKKVLTLGQELKRSYDEECSLGNAVADAMKFATSVQIALQNPGGLQTNLSPGAVTEGSLYSCLPFENAVISMNLTGKDIKDLLEISFEKKSGVLQVSGLIAVAKMSNPPGERLVEILIEGKTLEPEKIYRVATNDFLFRGGDGFTPFTRGTEIKEFGSLRELFKDYLIKSQREGNLLIYQDKEGRLREIQ